MKKAFTLIEIIVTIIIIGIAVTAVPMIIMQTTTNTITSLQQEVVFRVKSKIAYILSADWDQNSYNQILGRTITLDINNVISDRRKQLSSVITVSERIKLKNGGLKNLSINSQQFNPDTLSHPVARSNFGAPASGYSGFYAMHHFHNAIDQSVITPENYDHVFNLKLTPNISYVDDNADYSLPMIDNFFFKTEFAGASTHIKMIEVTGEIDNANLTDKDNKEIVLRAYASNIGQSRLASKLW